MTTVIAPSTMTEVIHAAGGIVFRHDEAGVARVAVVWRELRGDWTFPKGKLDPQETYEQAAAREVEEETGMACAVTRFIGTTEYQHRKGRQKVVAYFLMAATDVEFVANDEVDELRWCTVREAEHLLTWDRDRDLLERAACLEELADRH